jgi:hypothetical protein
MRVFYAEVLSGLRMPNLMYMTSFENKEDRDAHWKTLRRRRMEEIIYPSQYQKNAKADVI